MVYFHYVDAVKPFETLTVIKKPNLMNVQWRIGSNYKANKTSKVLKGFAV